MTPVPIGLSLMENLNIQIKDLKSRHISFTFHHEYAIFSDDPKKGTC